MKHRTITRSADRTAQSSEFNVAAPRLRPSVHAVRHALSGLAAVAALQLATPAAFALPTGEQLKSGNASVDRPTATQMDITQTTLKAAYDWQTFSIQSGEKVNVNQTQGSSSVLMNRVVGNDQSQIYGALNANGKVFLVNPNGILFAPGASVNVGGLAASTLDISKENFESGNYVFSGGKGTGAAAGTVVNQTTIHAPSGYAALIGTKVKNEGVIIARTVALAAGQRVALDMIGDRLINVRVEQSALGALALNKGAIQAEGGSVFLMARSADALLDTVVNNTGIIRATSLVERNGTIVLDGGSHGVVANSGTLDVSGTAAGATGGTVKVLGEYVALANGTHINASGDAGGGTVLVGGNFHGAGPEANASQTIVASDASINADAINSGNGGNVVVWSNDATQFRGSISARGGAQSGDGGFVEVSGKQFLAFHGSVDTRAPNGKTGTLLLDPADVEVRGGTGDGSTAANGGNGTDDGDLTFKGDPSGTTGTVTAADTTPTVIFQSELEGIASTTNIVVQASHDITFNTTVAFTNNRLDLAQTAGNSATFDAGNALAINGVGITTAGGDLVLKSGSGGIADIGNINAGGGTLFVNTTGTATQAAAGIISGTTALTKQGTGILMLSNANTYDGVTTVDGGTLRVTNASGLGSTTGSTSVNSTATLQIDGVSTAEAVTLNTGATLSGTGTAELSGVLTLAGTNHTITAPVLADTLALSGQVTGSGGFDKLGAGKVTLSNNTNDYTGVTSVQAGTLVVSAANGLGATGAGNETTVSGATLSINNVKSTEDVTLNTDGVLSGTGAAAELSGVLTLAGTNHTITTPVLADTLALSGQVTGSGGFSKAGAGTLTLSATNTYTGTTVVNAGTLTLQNGSAIPDTGAVELANAAGVTLDLAGSSETIGSLAGGGTTGGTVTNSTTSTTSTLTTGGNNNPTTFSGVIQDGAGTMALTKEGTGVFTLAGTNTYSGVTNVNAGTLHITNASGLGSTAGNTNVNTATLQIDGVSTAEAVTLNTGATLSGTGTAELSGVLTLAGTNHTITAPVLADTLALSGQVTGSGGFDKLGAGKVTLSNNTNDYTGVTSVQAGTLVVSAANGLGATGAGNETTVSGATLSINNVKSTEDVTLNTDGVLSGTGAAAELSGVLTLAGTNHTITTPVLADTLALSGQVTGSGGFDKLGAGKVTLSNNTNDYTGVTSVQAGTLVVSAANGLGATGAGNETTVSGATLSINGVTSAEAVTLNTGATLSGTGTAELSGVLTLAGTNHTITAPVLADTLALSGQVTGSGGFDKLGAGKVTLSNNTNDYTGVTSVQAGTLVVSAANGLGATGAGNETTVSGATLSINNVKSTEDVTLNTDGVLSGTGAAAELSGVLTLAGTNHTITTPVLADTLALSGQVTGSGGFSKAGAGTLTLSATNTYTGTTVVNAGTLQLQGGAAIVDTEAVLLNAGTLQIDNAETIGRLTGASGSNVVLNDRLTFGDGVDTSIASTISGTSGLTKQGTSVVSVSGNNTYSGVTNINVGALAVQSNTALGTAAGNTVVASGAALLIDGNGLSIAEPLSIAGTGLSNGGAIRNLGGSNTLTGAIAQTAASRVNSNAGLLTITGGISNGGFLLTVGGAGNTAVSTIGISGAGGLAKDGAGTLTLSANNTYTGATAINSGTLELSGAGLLHSSDVTVETNGIFQLTNVTNNVGVTLNGGTLRDSGTSTQQATVTLSGTEGTIDTSASGDVFNVTGTVTDGGAQILRLAGVTGSTINLQNNVTVRTLTTTATGQNISMTGASNTILSTGVFNNTGTLRLGDAPTDTFLFTGGLVATAPTLTTVGGAVRTTNQPIFLGNTTTTAGASVDAGTGTISIDGGGVAVDLGTGTFKSSNTGTAIDIENATTLKLANLSAALGTANIGTANSVSGAVTQNAGTTINADTLTGSTGSTVLLDQANTITSLGSFSSKGGFTLNDLNGLTVTGTVSDATGLTSITTKNGDLKVTTGTVAGSGVSLRTDISGNISLGNTVDARTGTLTLTSAGTITQPGGTIKADTLTGSAVGSVSLTQANNTITNLDSFTSSGGFTLNDLNGLNVTGAVTTNNIGLASITTSGGNLAVTTGSVAGDGVTLVANGAGSDITLNGTVNGNAGTVTLTAADLISQTGGIINTTGTLTGSAGTSVTLDQANTIANLGAFTSHGAFKLNDAGGGLNVTGAVTTSNIGLASITTSGGNLAVTTGSVAGDGVTLVANGAGSDITLNGAVNGNAGTVTLTAADLISQTAAGTINTTGTLTGSAGTTAMLDQGNTIGSLGAFTSSGGFKLNDTTGGLNVTGNVSDATGAVSIVTAGGPLTIGANISTGGAAAGTLVLTGVGINQTAGTIKATGAATVNGGAGQAVTLTSAGNDFGDMLAVTGGAVKVTDANALTVQLTTTGDTYILANAGGSMDLLTIGGSTGNLIAVTNGGGLAWNNLTAPNAILVAAKPVIVGNPTPATGITGPGSKGNAVDDPTVSYINRNDALAMGDLMIGNQFVLVARDAPKVDANSTIQAGSAVFNIAHLVPGNRLRLVLTDTAGGLRLLATEGDFRFREGSTFPAGVTTLNPNAVGVFIADVPISSTRDQLSARAAVSAAQQSALSSTSSDARQSFGTDSVTQQIDMGFAGDVGIAPTMAHNVPLQGEIISTPEGVSESKGGQ